MNPRFAILINEIMRCSWTTQLSTRGTSPEQSKWEVEKSFAGAYLPQQKTFVGSCRRFTFLSGTQLIVCLPETTMRETLLSQPVSCHLCLGLMSTCSHLVYVQSTHPLDCVLFFSISLLFGFPQSDSAFDRLVKALELQWACERPWEA